ncbi:GNAT family N-acetyltransferase [Streptomyces marispadix]|uniref:GNAT family N-acetyltransferase n=1 Tax=Streptomyces marispadix TaxID=2922868 RepID=A0ABS9T5G0_9ACTN|nr:GNAT family N-acetyltransferase [Streptomyces marispadix]MCH6163752.1 GNAT family N-acetyltransferase [Streptomyces marispadix]
MGALVELHANPLVNRFVPAFSHEQALKRLMETEEQWAERGHGLCAVELRSSGEFIGRSGLNHWPQFDEVEAGWALKPASWGNGYATEAGAAVVDRGFSHLRLDRVTAMISPENAASARVAGRLGFAPLRRDEFLGRPVTVYALDAPAGRRPSGGTDGDRRLT